ncbi:COX15/CtaA family protein [Tunturibacter empetritectus]|uniref:Cytochrome c oxidase assembly protein subunit 15 n=1 Tax=Tunturiibacter empetritectus TaxID=3069691 RepID=A0A7W8MT78_9BACT|nr:COX15/CtaA family protein [Edaphobacter lichenicola]MBB5317909.1 cytochrome c oxidase assembly protein subunit 15 [Edaphobacter lichenicola]
MATAGAVKTPDGSTTTRLETSRALVRFAWVVVGYNVLVILWGALVRATGSGAGCGNHWPLCNGQVIPLSPRIDTIIEFTHRCMTGGSTFLVVGLLIWTFRGTLKGQAARTLAVVSMVLLLNEAFLGALLVKLGYVTGNQSMGRVVVLSIHLSNTLLLLAALTLTARLLGTGQRWTELSGSGARKLWALLGLGATLIVGVSGSLAALGDTLFPASSLRAAFAQDFAPNSPWLLRLRGVHPVSAVIAAAFVLWLVAQARRAGAGRVAGVVLSLLCFQFALGLADVLLLAPVWMQILHLLGADLYWVALVALATTVVWPKRISDGRYRAN